jgi:hypothetical protein
MLHILQDYASVARGFRWNGAIAPDVLDAWLNAKAIQTPPDYREFLLATGGGEAFESEEFFAPFGAWDPHDHIESVNEFHRSNGLRTSMVVFHEGFAGLTAFVTNPVAYVTLAAGDYSEIARYASLDEWYDESIRPELAARYGLIA